jgi:hypothetical protein
MDTEIKFTNKIVVVDIASGTVTEREMTEKELADAIAINTDAVPDPE